MSMTQGEAVFQAVLSTLGEVNGKVELTSAQKSEVHEKVIAFFASGQCVHTKNPTPEQMKKYVPGLVNNWVRKDPRLNGNQKYVTKNPGSRAGSSDESVKAMRLLLSVTTDPEAKSAIESEMKLRLEAIKPKATINTAALPESLRHLVR